MRLQQGCGSQTLIQKLHVPWAQLEYFKPLIEIRGYRVFFRCIGYSWTLFRQKHIARVKLRMEEEIGIQTCLYSDTWSKNRMYWKYCLFLIVISVPVSLKRPFKFRCRLRFAWSNSGNSVLHRLPLSKKVASNEVKLIIWSNSPLPFTKRLTCICMLFFERRFPTASGRLGATHPKQLKSLLCLFHHGPAKVRPYILFRMPASS